MHVKVVFLMFFEKGGSAATVGLHRVAGAFSGQTLSRKGSTCLFGGQELPDADLSFPDSHMRTKIALPCDLKSGISCYPWGEIDRAGNLAIAKQRISRAMELMNNSGRHSVIGCVTEDKFSSRPESVLRDAAFKESATHAAHPDIAQLRRVCLSSRN